MLLETNSLICWCSLWFFQNGRDGGKNPKIIKNEGKLKREKHVLKAGGLTWHGELWICTVAVCFPYFLVMPKASRNDQTWADEVLVNFHLAAMMEAEVARESTLAVGGWKGKVNLVEPSGLFHPYHVISWHTLERALGSLGWILACLWFLQWYNAAKVLLRFGKTVAKWQNLGLGDSNPLFFVLQS